MKEVPEELMTKLYIQYNNDLTTGSFERVIKTALEWEREKCAKIAENGPRSPYMIALMIRGKGVGNEERTKEK